MEQTKPLSHTITTAPDFTMQEDIATASDHMGAVVVDGVLQAGIRCYHSLPQIIISAALTRIIDNKREPDLRGLARALGLRNDFQQLRSL